MLAAIHIQLIVGTIFIILYSVTILGLVLVIITENRNPLKTIPWVIVLLLAPGIGLLFYFFFGQDNRKQRIISRRTYKRIMKRPQEGKLPQDACVVPDPYKPPSYTEHKSRFIRMVPISSKTCWKRSRKRPTISIYNIIYSVMTR